MDTGIVAEEMGRLTAPGPLLGVNVVAAALSEAANADEHAELITALMAGEAVASWAVYEPRHGWAPLAPGVQAARDGSGYVVSGIKDRVEAGDQADWFLVTAAAPDGLVQLLVPAAGAGSDGHPRAEPGRGAAVRPGGDGRRARARDQRGQAGGPAEAAVNRQIQIAVALQCAETVGVIRRVFEFTTQWAFDRYSFGRPLASYQALKHRFADMKLWLEAGTATASAAAHAAAQRADDADELASVAKSYVGQRATDIVQDCVQMHGGIGVTWEHDIHLYLRRATVNRAMFGTPGEHRRRLADLLEGDRAMTEQTSRTSSPSGCEPGTGWRRTCRG